MINIAVNYKGVGRDGIAELMAYYNEHCFPLVSAERKYRIQEGDNWCAMFTSVMAHMAGVSPQRFPYEVSVYFQAKWAKQRGVFNKSLGLVMPNDLIVYDWGNNGTLNHVGIVMGVSNGIIEVIEGNYLGTVGVRQVSVESRHVHGYISVAGRENKFEDERIGGLVRDTLAGKFGNGVDRMERLGDDYWKVQEIINSK